MLYDFLRNEKNGYEELLTNHIKQLETLETSRIETKKFIKILNQSTDRKYAGFTPFEVTKEEDAKLIELKKTLASIEDEIQQLQITIAELDGKVKEYDEIMKEALRLENAQISDKDSSLNGLDRYGDSDFRLKVLSTQEMERQRIARELHDSPVQMLTALIHKLQLSARLIDMDSVRSKLELVSSTKSLKESINEMRRIIYDLRPMALDDLGLQVSLERELSRLEETHDVEISLIIQGEINDCSSVFNSTVFRIVQEACSNALKHASPTKIHVTFHATDEKIEFHIIDNGYGFDTSSHVIHSEKEWYGFGLTSMKERIFLLSGSLKIKSRVGEGTDICIIVPKKRGDMNGD